MSGPSTRTNQPSKGHGQGHVTHFKFWPNHIFIIGEARHFKFCVLIDMVYECMHDILLLKGMCSGSCDLFKFTEISDISEKWCKIET